MYGQMFLSVKLVYFESLYVHQGLTFVPLSRPKLNNGKVGKARVTRVGVPRKPGHTRPDVEDAQPQMVRWNIDWLPISIESHGP